MALIGAMLEGNIIIDLPCYKELVGVVKEGNGRSILLAVVDVQ